MAGESDPSNISNLRKFQTKIESSLGDLIARCSPTQLARIVLFFFLFGHMYLHFDQVISLVL